MGGQGPLHRGGPDVLAAGDDEVSPPPVDPQAAVPQLAEVAGGQPAVRGLGVGAVAVGPQQHGAPEPDLAVVGDADLDAIEGDAVVDHAAAGLGHAVGGHDVGGAVGRRGLAAHEDRPEGAGSMRASAVGTSDVRVHPSAAARVTASASKASCDVRGVPVSSARVTTDRPPTWASGRQASQRSRSGSTRVGGWTPGGGRHGVVGQHHRPRLAGGAAGGHDHRIAVLDRSPPSRRVRSPSGPTTAVGRRAASAAARAGAGQARVERRDRVAVVPGPAQRVDERLAHAVQRHQLGHGPGRYRRL
jgi:hypothetical protein